MKIKERTNILVAAKTLSNLFRPSYYPLVGFLIMLTMTYLSLLPWGTKITLLVVVYVFTILLPYLGVLFYRYARRLSRQELQLRENRVVSYIMHIICYVALLYLLRSIHAPKFVSGIVIISLLVQFCCAVITLWWKISMHSAGVGAIIGAVVAYSMVFHFYPVWWLCLAILVSGLVNSSRMFLRQHTLWQVLGGTAVGFACGLVGLFI